MKKSFEEIIGKAARKARIALGMTQEDAAEKIGVSVEFYARIERGQASPGFGTFVNMAIVFQGADQLLGLTQNESAQRILKEYADNQPTDPPELLRLFRKLRKSDMNEVHFFHKMVNALEKLGKGTAGSDDEGSDDEGSDDEGSDDEGSDDEGIDDEGIDDDDEVVDDDEVDDDVND